MSAAPLPVAVLASGGGSNLQALLDACATPNAPARVALVVTDRPAGAEERARQAGVATHRLARHDDAAELLGVLETHGIRFVVLAGYLRLIPAPVVEAYEGRMVNIHPALLPAFGGRGMYGKRVHEAVLASGATVSGATVHLVTREYDRGPILAQWPVPVLAGDTPDTLQQRVLAVEHRLLPAVVLAAAGAGASGRAVRLTPRDDGFGPGLPNNLADRLTPADH